MNPKNTRMFLWPKSAALRVAVLSLAARFTTAILSGAEMRIDHIERLGSNQVTIHIDTIANRTYTVQYIDRLSSTNTNGPATGTWSNLYVIPSEPFPNHHILVDGITTRQRFYRLRITP